MIRRRLLAVAVGAGVALAAVPAVAEVDAGRESATAQAEARALALLERAASAGRRLTYTGTQYVASWRSHTSRSALVELHHDPVGGSVVEGAGAELPEVASTAVLDPRMLRQLASTHLLTVAGPGRCAGRTATVVEAHRAGGELAGRFWVDRETGVLLRREVFDGDGRRARSSAFVDLDVVTAEPDTDAQSGADAQAGADAPTAAATRTAPVMATVRSGTERPAPEAVQRLRRGGWHVPESLPGGFRLFETRREAGVLHLAYTDGLSTLSLFEQDGRLGSSPPDGFSAESVDGRPVWMRRSAPERVVWSGGGRVWTLVSDAPEAAVRAVVAALPRDPAQGNGITDRLSRGLARLGGMLNPFG